MIETGLKGSWKQECKGGRLVRSCNFLSVSARAKITICIAVAGVFAVGACATKQFEEMAPLDASKVRAMSCEDIEQEFLMLQRHERGVDEEATSGQVEQMLWGGIWSVMADEKLEHVARQKIRDRERQLYEAKLKMECP